MPDPKRWLTLAVLCLAVSMIVIDNTILAVAIPSLARELPPSETDLQWIATSYGLVLAGLLLPLAVLGDRRGRKGVLLIGLAVFGAASGAAAFATSPLMLAVARGVMGVGGACTMPSTLSVLGNVFDARERGRAIAIWSGVAGFASAAGPIAGGLLLAHFWWGSIFLVNVPLAAITIVAAVLFVPTSRDPDVRPLDRGSALRWSGASTAALLAIIEGPQQGWASPLVLGAMVLAVVLLGAFVQRERTSRRPLIPRETARDPRLRWGAAAMAASFFSAFGVSFVLTQWLQGPRHLSALGAGIYFVPNAMAAVVASLCNPRSVRRFGQGAVAAAGLVCMAVGAAGAAIGVATSSEAVVVVAAVVIGAGVGTTAPSGAELIMSSASAEQAGAAAGVNETIVEAAGALGIAVLGTVLAATHGVRVAAAGRRGGRARRRGRRGERAQSSTHQTSIAARARALSMSGAPEASSEFRAMPAMASSSSPRRLRTSSYSSSRFGPKRRGSSELRLHRTPASSSAGSGCASIDGTTDSITFDVGHTSRHTASRPAGARGRRLRRPAHRAGCDRRRARRGRRSPMPGPASSPACGTLSRPASRAIAKAGANGSGGQSVSSLASPNPTTPRSAYLTASSAWSTASDGSTVRSAATTTPTPMPNSRAAFAAASRTISSVSSGGPIRALWCGEVDRGLDPDCAVDRRVLHHLPDELL